MYLDYSGQAKFRQAGVLKERGGVFRRGTFLAVTLFPSIHISRRRFAFGGSEKKRGEKVRSGPDPVGRPA
jgi:hypothetical protein